MHQFTPRLTFTELLRTPPQAVAWIQGNADYPQLNGSVNFYNTPYGGALIESEIFGLFKDGAQPSISFFAMHIHELGNCSDDFQKTGLHYNPQNSPHPYHGGDLLPLISNYGYAWSTFFDDRFSIEDILDRSVVIHSQRDDFTTQPSGDSGTKIACGVIREI